MDDRVHLVARSRSPDVDVGKICASLGGGGHPYAASASIKNRTLTQVREELFGLLYSQVNPQILVRQIMLAGRAVVVKKAKPLPIECIVRGYITGSGLKDYQATGTVGGHPLPAGLIESQILPEPIFTPSTKADLGAHGFDPARKSGQSQAVRRARPLRRVRR